MYIEELLHIPNSDIDESGREMKENVSNSTSLKRIVYKQINLTLSVHLVYYTNTLINEHHRVNATYTHSRSESGALEQERTRKVATRGKAL